MSCAHLIVSLEGKDASLIEAFFGTEEESKKTTMAHLISCQTAESKELALSCLDALDKKSVDTSFARKQLNSGIIKYPHDLCLRYKT